MADASVGSSLGVTEVRNSVDRGVPGVSSVLTARRLADRAKCASSSYPRRQIQ
jgi:hypothetical protein